MSEHEGPRQESESDLLLKRLQGGQILPEDFLKEVGRLDQSTLERSDAANNLALLLRPEVRKLFESDEAHRDDYFNEVSLACIHIAQNFDINDPQARIYYDQAWEAVKQIKNPDWDDWNAYVEAYQGYFAKDREWLGRLIPRLEGRNLEIARLLLEKLN